MRRIGLSSWSAFERTVYADILALVSLAVMCATLWTAGAI